MPPLTKEAWKKIRAAWEVGESTVKLGKKHGCSDRSIRMRAKAEGWARPEGVKAEIRRKAKERMSKSPPHDPQALEEAIEERVDATAEVIKRHREEAQAVRRLMQAGISEHGKAKTLPERQNAFETLKAAKITSETLRNLHVVERKAWNLDTDKNEDVEEIIIQRSYGL